MKEKSPTDKEQIIKDTFQLTSARYLSQGIGFFTAIAMRRFLGPFYMGIWSLFKVIIGYVPYLFFGVERGAVNKIPFYAGSGDKHSEEEVKNTSFSVMFLVSALAGAGLLTTALILRNHHPKEVIIGLCALSIYLILNSLCTFYRLLLRAKRNFSLLSKATIFDAVINLILIFLLVSRFKIYGLYMVLILVLFLNIIYIHIHARYRVRFGIKRNRVLSLMRVGFPITVVGLLQWVLGSLDRIMIAKMIGIASVGFYSIPIMVKSYAGQLSGFGTVLYPRLMEAYGKSQNLEEIKKYVTVPTAINAYILPVILGVIFFIVPLLVRKILPKFIPGILAMQILLLEIFFASCCAQAYYFIIAMKKQARVIFIVISAIILNVIGNYVLIKKGYGIYGVAYATSFVTFLNFIVLQTYAMKHFAKAKEILFFLGKIIAPLIYTLIIALFLESSVKIPNMYIETAVKSFLLLVASLPGLLYINRETKIINLIFNMLKRPKS
ncbi:MAG: oligosaccharide flippase family protein [Candidatus Omnitrophica bacterium]|nr:oligosaccharide flippase family protein [Candidatus Omnitrophota bacterium]